MKGGLKGHEIIKTHPLGTYYAFQDNSGHVAKIHV